MININLGSYWIFWLFVIIFIIIVFLIWLFFGGRKHKFIGLTEDGTKTPLARYLNPKLDFSDLAYDDNGNNNNQDSNIEDYICDETITQEKLDQRAKKSIRSMRSIRSSRSSRSVQSSKISQDNKMDKSDTILLDEIKNLNGVENVNENFNKIQDPNEIKNINKPKHNLSPDQIEKLITAYHGESKGEALCRRYLTEIYGKEFPRSRPDFLKNAKTNYNLELDCYNEEESLALEYSGIQHYKYPNRYHKTKEKFLEQRQRDLDKIQMCDASGVYMITVPYNIPHNQIKDFIIYYLPENVSERMEKERRENV